MKDITKNIIRYTVDVLIILIILVALARTNNMPVVVPEPISDFIIDTSNDILSGKAFSSFTAFLTEISDFFLSGGTDKQNKKKLKLYRDRINGYFEKTAQNLLYTSINPKIRRSLPDFNERLSGVFAQSLIQKLVDDYYDVDQISLISGRGRLIVRSKKTNALLFNEAQISPDIYKKALSMRMPYVQTIKTGRFLLIAPFSSVLREKRGFILMVLNTKAINEALEDVSLKDGNMVYIIDSDSKFLIHSRIEQKKTMLFFDKVKKGQIPISFLTDSKFTTIGAAVKRSYSVSLNAFLESGRRVHIGLLAPEGSILRFIMLLVRFALFVFALVVLIFLVKKILRKTFILTREKRLTKKMLNLSLNKAITAGEEIRKAGEEAINAAKKGNEIAKNAVSGVKDLVQKRVNSAITGGSGSKMIAPSGSSASYNKAEGGPEYKWSGDVGNNSETGFDPESDSVNIDEDTRNETLSKTD